MERRPGIALARALLIWVLPLTCALPLACGLDTDSVDTGGAIDSKAQQTKKRQTPVLPEAALTSSADERVAEFAEVAALVRYFHPTDASEKIDWPVLLALGVEAVREAGTVRELYAAYAESLGAVAPTLELWHENEGEHHLAAGPESAEIFWQYRGVAHSEVGGPWKQRRVGLGLFGEPLFPSGPGFRSSTSVELSCGLRVLVRHRLSEADAGYRGGLSKSERFKAMQRRRDQEGVKNLSLRQAGIVEVWALLRHFFPYQQGRYGSVEVAWKDNLTKALAATSDDSTLIEFANSLAEITVPLKDGHAFLQYDSNGRGVLPVSFARVFDAGKRVVAVSSADEGSGLLRGDKVVAMNGQPIDEVIVGKMARRSGSPELRDWRTITYGLASGSAGEKLRIDVERRNGERRERVSVELSYAEGARPQRDRYARQEVAPGIIKMDIAAFDSKVFEREMKQLPGLRGLIIDMRGYPNDDAMKLVEHLVEEDKAQWMHTPHIEAPGEFAGWSDTGWNVSAKPPLLGAQTIFLVSPECASYCESVLAYADHAKGVRILGEPSGGANGNVAFIDALPGMRVGFSGMAVTDLKGEVLQSRGIAPDQLVHQSLASLRAEQDDMVQAAIQEFER